MKGLSILTDLFNNTQYFINTFDNKERGIVKNKDITTIVDPNIPGIFLSTGRIMGVTKSVSEKEFNKIYNQTLKNLHIT